VYQRLRDLVVTGRLAPGAPLIEADLSKRLGASRTPIRAALRRLQQEGFVAASPVGQTLRPIVAPLTAGDLAEVFLMVGAFEATAARAAADLEPARREALASELEEVGTGLETAGRLRPPDLAALQALEVRFHGALAGAASGPRLRGELDVLHPQAERYRRAYGPAALHALSDAVDERQAIVAALRAGDGNLAAQGVAAHWRRSLERLRPVVMMLGEQGTW
jgi:DNA-binding GntR family transcriptional regulator